MDSDKATALRITALLVVGPFIVMGLTAVFMRFAILCLNWAFRG